MLPKMRKDALSITGDKPGGPGRPHATFSQNEFLKSLVNFVVANDQVRSVPH